MYKKNNSSLFVQKVDRFFMMESQWELIILLYIKKGNSYETKYYN